MSVGRDEINRAYGWLKTRVSSMGILPEWSAEADAPLDDQRILFGRIWDTWIQTALSPPEGESTEDMFRRYIDSLKLFVMFQQVGAEDPAARRSLEGASSSAEASVTSRAMTLTSWVNLSKRLIELYRENAELWYLTVMESAMLGLNRAFASASKTRATSMSTSFLDLFQPKGAGDVYTGMDITVLFDTKKRTPAAKVASAAFSRMSQSAIPVDDKTVQCYLTLIIGLNEMTEYLNIPNTLRIQAYHPIVLTLVQKELQNPMVNLAAATEGSGFDIKDVYKSVMGETVGKQPLPKIMKRSIRHWIVNWKKTFIMGWRMPGVARLLNTAEKPPIPDDEPSKAAYIIRGLLNGKNKEHLKITYEVTDEVTDEVTPNLLSTFMNAPKIRDEPSRCDMEWELGTGGNRFMLSMLICKHFPLRANPRPSDQAPPELVQYVENQLTYCDADTQVKYKITHCDLKLIKEEYPVRVMSLKETDITPTK